MAGHDRNRAKGEGQPPQHSNRPRRKRVLEEYGECRRWEQRRHWVYHQKIYTAEDNGQLGQNWLPAFGEQFDHVMHESSIRKFD